MKILSLLFIILFVSTSIVQAVPTPKDSTKVKQVVIAKRLDSLSASLQRVIQTNDSLNKELYYYRAKDDFYVMAVDRQGSHFEWFVSLALAIASLFSYGYFRFRIETIRKEFQNSTIEQRALANALEKKALSLSYSFKKTAATINGRLLIISKIHENSDYSSANDLPIEWEVLSWFMEALEFIDYQDEAEVKLMLGEVTFFSNKIIKTIDHVFSKKQITNKSFENYNPGKFLDEDKLKEFHNSITNIQNVDIKKQLFTALYKTELFIADYAKYKTETTES